MRHVFEMHSRRYFSVTCVATHAPPMGGAQDYTALEGCDHVLWLGGLELKASLEVLDGARARRAATRPRAWLGRRFLIDLNGWTDGAKPAILAASAAPVRVSHDPPPCTAGSTMEAERLTECAYGRLSVVPLNGEVDVQVESGGD